MKHLIVFCAMLLSVVTAKTQPTTRDLVINGDGTIILKGNKIKKSTDGLYRCPKNSSDSIKTIGRKVKLKEKEPVFVTYQHRTDTSSAIKKGGKLGFVIKISSLTETLVVWGTDTMKLVLDTYKLPITGNKMTGPKKSNNDENRKDKTFFRIFWVIIVILVFAVGFVFFYLWRKKVNGVPVSDDSHNKERIEGKDNTTDESLVSEDESAKTISDDVSKSDNDGTVTINVNSEETANVVTDTIQEQDKEDKWKDVLRKYEQGLGLKEIDFNALTLDQLFEEIVQHIKKLKKDTFPTQPVKSEQDVIAEFIKEMLQKRIIREAFGSKDTPENKEQLINSLERLLKQKQELKTEISLDELNKICESPNPQQLYSLKKYVKSWLLTKFNFNVASNVPVDTAVEGYELVNEKDYTTRALKLVGDKVNIEFSDLDDFKSKWDFHNDHTPSLDLEAVLLKRLQEITKSNANSLESIIEELKTSAPLKTSDPSVTAPVNIDNMEVDGRKFHEAEADLKIYDKIKSITKFGDTAESIKTTIVQETKADILKNVVAAIPEDENINRYNELKCLVDKIKGSTTIEQLVDALKLLSEVGVKLIALEDAENRAIDEKQIMEERIIKEVKDTHQLLFNEDILDSDTLSAVNTLSQQVKKKIDEDKQLIREKESLLDQKDDELQKKNEIISEKNQDLKYVCNQYMQIIHRTFDQIQQCISDTYGDDKALSPLSNRFIQRVQNNDGFSVIRFMNVLKDIPDSDAEFNTKIQQLHDMFMKVLKNNSWIHGLTCMYLFVQNPKIAEQFSASGLDVHDITKAFMLTEHLLDIVGVQLHYPRLFIDIYNPDLYEEEALNDVRDYVNNVNDLVGSRQGIIIFLHRVGYTADGISHKPIVARFN